MTMFRTNRDTYFIRAQGSNIEVAEKAIKWLVEYSHGKAFLAVAGYRNLEGIITKALGETVIKNLKKNDKSIVFGTQIFLVTDRKPIYNAQNSPMVAFYPTSKFLDKLDSIDNISAILVVPRIFEEIEPWIATWNATELGFPPRERERPLIRNKVVEAALKSLTARVNLSTGIIHPSDRESAIQTFEILRNGDEIFSPEEVKTWLVAQGGWKATRAQEAVDVARAVLEGKKLRRGAPTWKENILEIWRKDALK